MLPTAQVRRRAAELIRDHRISAIWYGAAAPLSLLSAGLRSEGVIRTVASTHGHEVGWSMVPIARQLLRRIGRTNDVITFVSQFARRRISAALGPDAALEYLPPGVMVDTFRPDPAARAVIQARYHLGNAPAAAVGVQVGRPERPGQPDPRGTGRPGTVPDARVLIVGDGPDGPATARTGRSTGGCRQCRIRRQRAVVRAACPLRCGRRLRDAVPDPRLRSRRRGPGNCFPRGIGQWAPGHRRPVRRGAGDRAARVAPARWSTGGTSRRWRTRWSGCWLTPMRAAEWGVNGRAWVSEAWNWDRSAARLVALLSD